MLAVLQLVIGMARLSAAQTARRVGVASALMMMAMVFLVIGITGFAGALWIALARLLGPVSAALVIGGAGFLMAALLMLVAANRMKAPRPMLSPELASLLNEFKARDSGLGVWAPLIGAALLGFLASSKAKK